MITFHGVKSVQAMVSSFIFRNWTLIGSKQTGCGFLKSRIFIQIWIEIEGNWMSCGFSSFDAFNVRFLSSTFDQKINLSKTSSFVWKPLSAETWPMVKLFFYLINNRKWYSEKLSRKRIFLVETVWLINERNTLNFRNRSHESGFRIQSKSADFIL